MPVTQQRENDFTTRKFMREQKELYNGLPYCEGALWARYTVFLSHV